MEVRVNGKPRTLPDYSSVKDLIRALGLQAGRVVVELNGEPVQRSRFDAVKLGSGDVVEVVRPVPGG
jgi:sulfur carrier protein